MTCIPLDDDGCGPVAPGTLPDPASTPLVAAAAANGGRELDKKTQAASDVNLREKKVICLRRAFVDRSFIGIFLASRDQRRAFLSPVAARRLSPSSLLRLPFARLLARPAPRFPRLSLVFAVVVVIKRKRLEGLFSLSLSWPCCPIPVAGRHRCCCFWQDTAAVLSVPLDSDRVQRTARARVRIPAQVELVCRREERRGGVLQGGRQRQRRRRTALLSHQLSLSQSVRRQSRSRRRDSCSSSGSMSRRVVPSAAAAPAS